MKWKYNTMYKGRPLHFNFDKDMRIATYLYGNILTTIRNVSPFTFEDDIKRHIDLMEAERNDKR